jgi:phosphatidylglycerophosphate synthase
MSELPPFRTLLKSRDVEDPVNLYVNRPLAYAFVSLVYRTPLTPNQVTLLSMLVGLAAAACWFVGTSSAMLIGGILLWTSAILDGADGLLARAKGVQSQFGRALDGTADMIVAAASLAAAFYHLWVKHREPVHLWLAIPAVLCSVAQIFLYDYYKDYYLMMTRPGRGGEGETVAEVERRVAEMERQGAPRLQRLIMKHAYLGMLRSQARLIRLLNPASVREGQRFVVTDATAAIYARHHRGPMQLWALVSLAPHNYLISIFGMIDRLDIYLWLRLMLMNALMVIAVLWQRHATRISTRALASA